MNTLLVAILAFLASGGIVVLSDTIGGGDLLYEKQIVIVLLVAAAVTFAVGSLRGMKASVRETVCFSVIIAAIGVGFLYDLISYGGPNLQIYAHCVLVVIYAFLLHWFQENTGIDVFLVVATIISATGVYILIYAIIGSNIDASSLFGLCQPKRLSEFSFVNRFAYVSAFGFILLLIALRSDFSAMSMRQQVVYTILTLMPLVYIIAAKSKGGLLLLIIGALVVNFKRTAIVLAPFVLLVGLAFTFNIPLCDSLERELNPFERVMMWGRTADNGSQAEEKIEAMLTNRMGASVFWNNPKGFLMRTPLGVGTTAATQSEYRVPGEDVIMKTHSLMFILIDSFGLLLIGIGAAVLWSVIRLSLPGTVVLGIVMLAPVALVGDPLISYSIPLFVAMSGVSLKRTKPVRQNAV